jgi:predicted dehydrogenase
MNNLILVGNGQWGKNYVNTLRQFSNVNLKIANRNNWQSLIDQGADGVIICTPPDSHIEIAHFSLSRNIPTMIEKPVALSMSEVLSLETYTVPILVNYIHLFSEAYQLAKQSIQGPILEINSIGYNKGPLRTYSSLWDYGSHNIAMILDLINKMPTSITAKKEITPHGELFHLSLKFDQINTLSIIGNGAETKALKLDIKSKNHVIYDNKDNSSLQISPLTSALQVFIRALHGHNDGRLGLYLTKQVTQILIECENICNILI